MRCPTRIGGRVHWLWRTVDERGQTLDVLLQEHRDAAAAERFFRRLLAVTGDAAPAQVTTDKLGSYAAALARVPELVSAEHLQLRCAARCDNRAERAHQPTRVRECVIRRFKSVPTPQWFLEAFSRVCNLFRRGRHVLRAAASRAVMRDRVVTWRQVAGLQAA
jgi:putative transposase